MYARSFGGRVARLHGPFCGGRSGMDVPPQDKDLLGRWKPERGLRFVRRGPSRAGTCREAPGLR